MYRPTNFRKRENESSENESSENESESDSGSESHYHQNGLGQMFRFNQPVTSTISQKLVRSSVHVSSADRDFADSGLFDFKINLFPKINSLIEQTTGAYTKNSYKNIIGLHIQRVIMPNFLFLSQIKSNDSHVKLKSTNVLYLSIDNLLNKFDTTNTKLSNLFKTYYKDKETDDQIVYESMDENRFKFTNPQDLSTNLHFSFTSKEIQYFLNSSKKTIQLERILKNRLVDQRNPDFYGLLNVAVDLTKQAIRVNLMIPVFELFIQEGHFISFRNCKLDSSRLRDSNPTFKKLLNDLVEGTSSFAVVDLVKNDDNKIVSVYLEINELSIEFIKKELFRLSDGEIDTNVHLEIPIKRSFDNQNFEELLNEVNLTKRSIQNYSTFPYILNESLQYDFVLEIDHYVHQIENTFGT